jgi:hypothetical protein
VGNAGTGVGGKPRILHLSSLQKRQLGKNLGRQFTPLYTDRRDGLLWGGSIFVYGAAVPYLATLGTAIGWPLSLATGLLIANAAGLGLGEWRHAPVNSHRWMYAGIGVLLIAVAVLSSANS